MTTTDFDKNTAVANVTKVFNAIDPQALQEIVSFSATLKPLYPGASKAIENIDKFVKQATTLLPQKGSTENPLGLSDSDLKNEIARLGLVFQILVKEVEIMVMVEVDKFIQNLAKAKNIAL